MADASERAEMLRARDLTGRDVIDSKGEKIGSVGELLIDRRSGRIGFLDVDFGLLRKTHVLVPVDRVDWSEDNFILGRWTRDQIKALPGYDPTLPITGAMLDELERANPAFYGSDEDEAIPVLDGAAQAIPLRDAKDFKLSKNAPDLKGWDVFGEDGERVGTVTQVLVDPVAMKVRYLDVDLLDDLFLLQDDRHVLIPTEAVELRERTDDVWITGVSAAQVARLPAYIGGPVSPAVERAVQDAFRPRQSEPEAESV